MDRPSIYNQYSPRLDCTGSVDISRGWTQGGCLNLKRRRLEWHAVDLGDGEIVEGVELLLRVEPDTLACRQEYTHLRS